MHDGDQPQDDGLGIPSFLKREPAPKTESESKMVKPIDDAAVAENDADEAPPKAPSKPAAKAKPNGHAKPEVKAKAKAAPAKAVKAAAKPAKAATDKAKAAAPAKAKAKGKAVERTRDPAKLDQFGFRKGSIKANAAAMYATKNGATLGEVKEKVGSVQFNLLTELEEKGFKVEKSQVKGDGPRKVTRYKLHTK